MFFNNRNWQNVSFVLCETGTVNKLIQVTFLCSCLSVFILLFSCDGSGSDSDSSRNSDLKLKANKKGCETVNAKENLLPGKIYFQLWEGNNALEFKSYNGLTKLKALANCRISEDVDISLQEMTAGNDLIQVDLKSNISADQPPTLHTLSNYTMIPTTPVDFLVNDIITIKFSYHAIEVNGVHLFNMPVVVGGAYSVNRSPTYPVGDGVGEVSFQVFRNSGDIAKVESTTILIVSSDLKRVLASVEMPLDYL
jgi:hypothetical protein